MRVTNTPLKKYTKMSPRSGTVCSKGRLSVVGPLALVKMLYSMPPPSTVMTQTWRNSRQNRWLVSWRKPFCSQEGVFTWQAVSRVLRGVPEDVLAVLPKQASLTCMAQHECKLLFRDDPIPRDHAFQIPPEYLPLVLIPPPLTLECQTQTGLFFRVMLTGSKS